MRKFNICFSIAAFLLLLNPIAFSANKLPLITPEVQKQMTPDDALQRLIAGNKRFVMHKSLKIDFIKKARATAAGQYPAAIVLSCIDSRVPPEIVFDQAIGNIFVTRTAANVINSDILGGMEFATKLAGAKLIVVMGHDACGAVKGACQEAKLGHLTQLLEKIQPAIRQAQATAGNKNCDRQSFINAAAADNVLKVVKLIPKQSEVIAQLIKEGKVKIVGAMYHLSTGKVDFLKDN